MASNSKNDRHDDSMTVKELRELFSNKLRLWEDYEPGTEVEILLPNGSKAPDWMTLGELRVLFKSCRSGIQ